MAVSGKPIQGHVGTVDPFPFILPQRMDIPADAPVVGIPHIRPPGKAFTEIFGKPGGHCRPVCF